MAKPKKETKPNTPADNHYIKINGKKIEDYVIEKAEEMLSKRGDIDPLNLINSDVVDLNLLSVYDNNHNVINYNLEGAKRGNEYWEEKTDEYIKTLEEINSLDISSFNRDKLKDVIVKHNKTFIVEFIMGIKANALDLASESTRLGYASRLADTLTDLQLQEIQKVGIKDFLELDLSNKPTTLNYYIDIEILKKVQEKAKTEYNELEEKYKNALKTLNKTTNELIHSLIGSEILVNLLDTQQKKVYEIYTENKDFYDKRHEKRNKIQHLTNEISQKLKEQNAYLNTPRYRALDTTKDVLNEMQQQNKNIDNLSLTTTLVNNKIFNQTLKSGEIVKVPINYTDKNTKLQQTNNVFITLNSPDKMDITLTPAHKVINDRVGTLLDYGVQKITARQLYNFINKGEPNNDYVDNDKLKELNDTLNSMAIWGDLDASEQFNNAIYKSRLLEYNKKGNAKGSAILHQQLINFKYLELKLPNGDIMYYYVFLDKPLFYQYAQQLQQIAVVPVEIYNINDIPKKYKDSKGKDKIKKGYKYKVQITDITRTIRDNLINDIELRKSKKNTNININNFLNECNFTDLDKKARENRLNNIEIILNNWIIKDYIKGYTINSNGRVKKYSISIFLTAEELNKARKDINIASNIIDIKKFI